VAGTRVTGGGAAGLAGAGRVGGDGQERKRERDQDATHAL